MDHVVNGLHAESKVCFHMIGLCALAVEGGSKVGMIQAFAGSFPHKFSSFQNTRTIATNINFGKLINTLLYFHVGNTIQSFSSNYNDELWQYD